MIGTERCPDLRNRVLIVTQIPHVTAWVANGYEHDGVSADGGPWSSTPSGRCR